MRAQDHGSVALVLTSGLKCLEWRAFLAEVARWVMWISGSQGETLGLSGLVVSLPLVKEKPHNWKGVAECL